MRSHNNKLFVKISLTLLSLLVVIGVGYMVITTFTARNYLQEVNQRLYGRIAQNTVKEVRPLVNGEVDTAAIKDIMHSMMVINPSVEVYLLDPQGQIVTFVAPYKKIKLQEVDLAPVQTFIAKEGNIFITGDDPRFPGQQNVFSAAPIQEEGELQGYIYIILASEEQSAVSDTLLGSYILRLGSGLFLVCLLGALGIGLLALWYLTRNLRTIIDTVQRFKEGDMDARIPQAEKGDLAPLAETFNAMADTLEANIDELKSVENLRRELIANVSHDLRTPLAIMQGYVETLLIKDASLSSDDRKGYLEIVLGSSEKLSKLIDQLFEYAKLEARQVQPQKEPFFISELAQDVFRKYQILAEEREIEIALNMPQSLPLVFADVALVERVFQNLLDNALKFTPKGGSVQIELEGQVDSVSVRVVDTGKGISAEEQAFIFERYQKGSRSGDQNKGAGLGLAIVKKILELHDASIRVQSRLNEGTAFSFQLPAYAG
ncbi:MAG: HAMP domain-containing sensor histidine kinase [Bacteroidota bacterium]